MDYHELDNTVSHYCNFLTIQSRVCVILINDLHYNVRRYIRPRALYITKHGLSSFWNTIRHVSPTCRFNADRPTHYRNVSVTPI